MKMEMEQEFVVGNQSGLHCRAAVALAGAVCGYDATIVLRSGEAVANADSILDIMALGCSRGTTVRVVASGPQAGEAMDAVARAFAENFGED